MNIVREHENLQYVFSLQRGDIKNNDVYLKLPNVRPTNNPEYPILLVRNTENNTHIRVDDLVDLTTDQLYKIALNNLSNMKLQEKRIYLEDSSRFLWIFKGNYACNKFLDPQFIEEYFQDIPLPNLMFCALTQNTLVVTSITSDKSELLNIREKLASHMDDELLSYEWMRYNRKNVVPVVEVTNNFERRRTGTFQKLRYKLHALLAS
ncbi:MAG: hypothetical protein MRY83_02440 [Flavobacteriales bacterium]|nr:hypothetical protein [Flavobacteriales bacterium]